MSDKKIQELEIQTVAYLLAAWPHLDLGSRRRVGQHYEERYPSFKAVFKHLIENDLDFGKADSLKTIMGVLSNDPLRDSEPYRLLQLGVLAAHAEIEAVLHKYNHPYNLIHIQDELFARLKHYLTELFNQRRASILAHLTGDLDVNRTVQDMLERLSCYQIDENKEPRTFEELLEDYSDNNALSGVYQIRTGFPQIDNMIKDYYGLVPGRLTVLEAKSGLGKTSFVSQLLGHMAITQEGMKALLLSYEMDRRSSMLRIMSQVMRKPVNVILRDLQDPMTPKGDYRIVASKLDKCISIEYPGNTGEVREVELRILDHIRLFKKPPELVVVDYIQQITMGKDSKNTSRAEDLQNVSRTLRTYAQHYNTHVMVASQVTEVDGVSRSFGSSGIEFAADHVLVITRSEQNEFERIIKFKKNRFGPDNQDIRVGWNPKYTFFVVQDEGEPSALPSPSITPSNPSDNDGDDDLYAIPY